MGVSWCRGAEVEAITQGTVNLRDDAVDVVFVVVAMPRWATLIEGFDASQRRFDFGPNPPISIRFAARSDPVDFRS